ncbi:hypothetical protein AcW1_000871 [Taiwanofungus camphoratus]|nr:hypothetical protein AcW1_000871 [Antrodia cinnamomea]
MPPVDIEDRSQIIFQKLKVSCVPLLGNSRLTPASAPNVSKLLAELHSTLQEARASGYALKPSLISYVFFPLSSILRRNSLSSIPDQVLERILIVLGILCDSWWWDLDEPTWEQIFMLCGAIVGDIDRKGKGKPRDDETKEAATRCLWALLRERAPEEDPSSSNPSQRGIKILSKFISHAQTANFIPVLGQAVNSLLTAAESSHMPLQKSSLDLLHLVIRLYLMDQFIPSIIPGVVSAMGKVALGTGMSKGWANGEVVAAALTVMQEIIIKAIGDAICIRDGAIRTVDNLEDLVNIVVASDAEDVAVSGRSPYTTVRTSSWVHGTASQLHIAMNILTPLVNHPTPTALLALSTFSEAVLSATTLTVPQSQPLLVSFLLSLARSSYASVSANANEGLRRLLSPPSTVRHHLLHVLMQISKDSLVALPRLIPSHSDAKVEHLAGLIESVCSIAFGTEKTEHVGVIPIAAGVGKLLGPNGGIEKWGWGLLSALEFMDIPVITTRTSAAQLMIETGSASSDHVPFPELTLTHVSSHSAHMALERMFRSMGRVAGDDCIFTVEWFMDIGQNNRGRRAVAALWCACRILEGVAGVSLDISDSYNTLVSTPSKRVEKLARAIAKRVAEFWMDTDEGHEPETKADNFATVVDEDGPLIEHVKGLISIHATADSRPSPAPNPPRSSQPLLHRAVSLQLLSITAGILEARFASLLLYTLYPILSSIVSESSLVSMSALAALDFISDSMSYASPANLLLSNFDYGLDAVSRRLTRRWLDVDATKVMAVLVRLVGRDVVQKAGDVVEECFDRLDEFHGYEIIVDGLVEVLAEVVKVIEDEDDNQPARNPRFNQTSIPRNGNDAMNGFVDWFTHRQGQPEDTGECIRDNSFPREGWGERHKDEKGSETGIDQEPEPNAEPPPSPSQALTKQIVSRSLYFLTHGSPMIRARILGLLSSAVLVLPESALLPSIHHAWPFILNRFSDSEPFVISAAASLVESLALHAGDFMYRRIWDDIWPRFRTILSKLESADAGNALTRREYGVAGTQSAYTYSHRLYRSLLRTMTAAMNGVQANDAAVWEAIRMFRRFLHSQSHDELQACARDLYVAIGTNNEDAVWLALSATQGRVEGSVSFLKETKWDISRNVTLIFTHQDNVA